MSAALVRLGRRVISGVPVATLLTEAAGVLAAELDADHVDILECVDDGLRLRAFHGPCPDEIGGVVDMPAGGYAEAVVASGDAVVVEDLERETRFTPSPRLLRMGLVSGIAVVIPGPGEDPYGLIGVHCARTRGWREEELDLTRNVATIAGGAIMRRRQALELNDDVLQALVVSRYALDRGELEVARTTLDGALASAREMISALLGEGADIDDALPGDLRRGQLG